jgi:hypothetical protein
VIIEFHWILEQGVESRGRCGFAGSKIETRMMPRTSNGRANDDALVERTAEVRAVGTVGP